MNHAIFEIVIQIVGTALTFLALAVSIVGLWYLKKYTDAAIEQVKSSVLPVVIVKVNVEDKTSIMAKNIGGSPALNCYWRLLVRKQSIIYGKFPYIAKDEKIPLSYKMGSSPQQILGIHQLLKMNDNGPVEIQIMFDSALGVGYFRRFEFQPEAGPDGRPMFYRFAENNPGINRLKWAE